MKTKATTLSFRADEEFKARIKALVDADKRKVSDWLRLKIEEVVEEEENRSKSD